MRKRHHAESAHAKPHHAPPEAEAPETAAPGAAAPEAAAPEAAAPEAAAPEAAVPEAAVPGVAASAGTRERVAPEAGAAVEGADAGLPAPAPGPAAGALEREVAEQKDRLLRTAADFDNFRKRAAREKAETWGRAQGDLIQKVLDVIDDLGRVAHLDPAQTSAEALHEGMGLVERKFLKVLEGVGLERLDPSGEAFDPNAHEAVMTTPTPSQDLDGAVAMVFQAGYRLKGMLLRPARVSVYAYAEPTLGEAVH